MRRFVAGLLILTGGWGLGWLTAQYRSIDTPQPAPSSVVTPHTASPAGGVAAGEPAATVDGPDTATLLQQNDFASVLERYDGLQLRAGEDEVAHARAQILSHVRKLIAGHRFVLAEQLLQRFLVSAYRDVDARLLLAEVLQEQQDSTAAIDQLYEARGYAWRPRIQQQITERIRSLVARQAKSLQDNDEQTALLALFQHLTELEPDHAPWFMQLAVTQLALDDRAAARNSLLLVVQDPAVGARARSMLSELNVALAGTQGTEPEGFVPDVSGIPLRRSGGHFIVEASPGNGRSLQLLIDTGASLTIFTPGVLAQRGIRYQDTGRTGVFNTANGPVRAPVYRIDSLAVGDWHVRQLEIGVLDLGERSGVDGLLGMNFLSHFRFFIDQNENLLRLAAD
jgi:clan AA aspartic protease (TIGR02281 family)